MQPIIAFTIIMLIWTVSDYISKKNKGLIIFLICCFHHLLDRIQDQSVSGRSPADIGFAATRANRRRDDHRPSRNAHQSR